MGAMGDIIFIEDFDFGERGMEGEKHRCERETSTWDQTCNLSVYPDQESNQQPYSSQDDAQPTEPFWPRTMPLLFYKKSASYDCWEG